MDAQFWGSLKNIKIISFSSAVHAICLSHQLNSFPIQYFPEWVAFSPAGYDVKSLFFWQRRSWPNWQTVTSILPVSQFEKLHHHVVIDPGFEIPPEKAIGPTPSEMLDGRLTSSVWFNQRAELFDKLREFNVFFLPREREGIGMSFLDAMRLGMVPVGLGHATYNEYVVDGVNGFIVSRNQRIDLPNLDVIAEKMKHYFQKGRANYLRRLGNLGRFISQPIDIPVRKESSIQRIAGKFQFKSKMTPQRDFAPTRVRSKNDVPLISIVTRFDGDFGRFEKTHRSICQQSLQDFDYIIVATDPVAELEYLFEPILTSSDHYIRGTRMEPHQWMREGASAARGRLILFLESGQEFVHSDSLLESIEAAPSAADLLYGHHCCFDESGNCELRLAPDIQVFAEAMRRGKRAPGWLREMPRLCSMLISRDFILRQQSEDMLASAMGPALLLKAYVEGLQYYHTNLVISVHYAPTPYQGSEMDADNLMEERLRKIIMPDPLGDKG